MIWLNWRDASGASDRRRLDWDDESKTFVTTLPHVLQSMTFDVATSDAKSGIHRIDVADPPAITQFKVEIEPAAYTGLPAKSLAGVPGEVRVTEFSRVQVRVEFNEPVASAELRWPVESEASLKLNGRPEQRIAVEESFPVQLSVDRRSGTVVASAGLTGSFHCAALK